VILSPSQRVYPRSCRPSIVRVISSDSTSMIEMWPFRVATARLWPSGLYANDNTEHKTTVSSSQVHSSYNTNTFVNYITFPLQVWGLSATVICITILNCTCVQLHFSMKATVLNRIWQKILKLSCPYNLEFTNSWHHSDSSRRGLFIYLSMCFHSLYYVCLYLLHLFAFLTDRWKDRQTNTRRWLIPC